MDPKPFERHAPSHEPWSSKGPRRRTLPRLRPTAQAPVALGVGWQQPQDPVPAQGATGPVDRDKSRRRSSAARSERRWKRLVLLRRLAPDARRRGCRPRPGGRPGCRGDASPFRHCSRHCSRHKRSSRRAADLPVAVNSVPAPAPRPSRRAAAASPRPMGGRTPRFGQRAARPVQRRLRPGHSATAHCPSRLRRGPAATDRTALAAHPGPGTARPGGQPRTPARTGSFHGVGGCTVAGCPVQLSGFGTLIAHLSHIVRKDVGNRTWSPSSRRLDGNSVPRFAAVQPDRRGQVWAPNGKAVATIRVGVDNGLRISSVLVLPLDGHKPRILAVGGYETLSRWPDGRTLVTVQFEDHYSVDVESGQSRRLSRFARKEFTAWAATAEQEVAPPSASPHPPGRPMVATSRSCPGTRTKRNWALITTSCASMSAPAVSRPSTPPPKVPCTTRYLRTTLYGWVT